MDDAKLVKHSVSIQGHQTSITLENIFWNTLKIISKEQNKSVKKLIEEIDESRTGNLSSAIRVYIMQNKHI